MAGKRSSRGSAPRYPRAARVSTTLQEIIADELVRIDDERLTFVTVTDIDDDPELNRAIVFFDSHAGEDADAEIIEPAVLREQARSLLSLALSQYD